MYSFYFIVLFSPNILPKRKPIRHFPQTHSNIVSQKTNSPYPNSYAPMGVANNPHPVRIAPPGHILEQNSAPFKFYEDHVPSASQVEGQQNYAASTAFFQR